MEIRKASGQDLDALMIFYNELIDYMAGDPNSPLWTKDVYPARSHLEDAAAAGELFFVKIGQEIAGAFVMTHDVVPGYENVPWITEADPEEASYLHLFAVSPSQRGKGIGTQILYAIADLCREQNQKTLRLDVLPNNTSAIELYEYAGFTNLGLLELNYGSVGRTMFVLMEYAL